MPISAFRRALRRGIGSAVVAIEKSGNRAQYSDAVRWCCLHDISYDWQSEGTKGRYLYAAIAALGEKEAFEKTIIEKYLSKCADRLFCQLGDILVCYAMDGSLPAKDAFYRKYAYFAAKNGRFTKGPSCCDEGFQWDEVVYHLACLDGFPAFKRYCFDAGALLHKNPRGRRSFYSDWFAARAHNQFGQKRVDAFLDKMYEKSLPIKSLVDALREDASAQAESRTGFDHEPLSAVHLHERAHEASKAEHPRAKMVRLAYRFANSASQEESVSLAKTLLREEDLSVKASLLLPFSLGRNPFPLDIAPLLECALSENAYLAEVSVDALGGIKDGRIHDFAVDCLRANAAGLSALPMLAENYRKSDDDAIRAAVTESKRVPHDVQIFLVKLYTRHRSKNAFASLLHVYRNGDCSFCRHGIVQAMRHCRVLTDEILEECLYDSYEDTRTFAGRILQAR
ncbi:MAG: hypothetical protein LBT26_05190 [Clostridiales Family XIII bacterium]|nr:hypothetical protein [Clostridiales Family XIII bacterium]